jgi:hypothetical protein
LCSLSLQLDEENPLHDGKSKEDLLRTEDQGPSDDGKSMEDDLLLQQPTNEHDDRKSKWVQKSRHGFLSL